MQIQYSKHQGGFHMKCVLCSWGRCHGLLPRSGRKETQSRAKSVNYFVAIYKHLGKERVDQFLGEGPPSTYHIQGL